MGTGKKEAARKVRQGKPNDGMGNVKTKGENFYRYVHNMNSVVVKWKRNGLTYFLVMLRRSRP